MNDNGAWIKTFTVHDITKTMIRNFGPVRDKGDYLFAAKEIKGISTETYMNNMLLFMNFVKAKKQ